MSSNISIIGNLGRDPEIKFGPKSAVTSLSIALTPRQRVGIEWQDLPTIWFKAVFFGEKAEEVVDAYRKGMRVKITGQLTVGQPWTDKKGVHHDGGYEIASAEIEDAPRVAGKGARQATDTSRPIPPASQTLPTSEVAPF